MKFRSVIGAGALVLGGLSTGIAGAHQEYNSCSGSADEFTVVTTPVETPATPYSPAGKQTLYVEAREVNGDSLYSIWVYLESNSHTGLQTKAGETSIADESDSEICTNMGGHNIKPDTLIF